MNTTALTPQRLSFPASRVCAAREGKPGAEAGTGVCGTGWVPFPSLRSAGNDKGLFCFNWGRAVEICNHSNRRPKILREFDAKSRVEQRRAFFPAAGKNAGKIRKKMPAPAGDEFDRVETQWLSFPASRVCAAREGKPGAETGTCVCRMDWVPFPSLRSAGNDKVILF
jgi:hypothetical protein